MAGSAALNNERVGSNQAETPLARRACLPLFRTEDSHRFSASAVCPPLLPPIALALSIVFID